MRANTPQLRVQYASEGLTVRGDRETQCLLLRELHLGELECGRPEGALAAAERMLVFGAFLDVAHQDVARACTVLGLHDRALEHLQCAVDSAPPERLPVHLSALGGLAIALGRPEDAVEPLRRALKANRPAGPPTVLIGAQLAIAESAAGMRRDAELELAYHLLLKHPAGEGYGRFLLGVLAFARRDRDRARVHLQAFVARARQQRVAVQAGLAAEIARAEKVLGRILLH